MMEQMGANGGYDGQQTTICESVRIQGLENAYVLSSTVGSSCVFDGRRIGSRSESDHGLEVSDQA